MNEILYVIIVLLVIILTFQTVDFLVSIRNLSVLSRFRGKKGAKSANKYLKKVLGDSIKEQTLSLEFQESMAEVMMAVMEAITGDKGEASEIDPARKEEIEKATMQATMEAIGQTNPILVIIGKRLYGDDWQNVLVERPEELQVIIPLLEKSGVSSILQALNPQSILPGQNGQNTSVQAPKYRESKSKW